MASRLRTPREMAQVSKEGLQAGRLERLRSRRGIPYSANTTRLWMPELASLLWPFGVESALPLNQRGRL